MTETVGQVLPFYFVGDESNSMSGAPIKALNQGLVELRDEVSAHPLIGKKIRFGVVTFADHADTELPLAPLTEELEMPTLAPRGGTRYGEVFDALRETIPGDIQALKSQGFEVHRPTVFFLSDGAPTDEDSVWRPALARLKDREWPQYPNILAFGVGEAKKEVIAEVASRPAYGFMMQEGASPAAAIREFATALIHSVVTSASAAARGESKFQFEKPTGFVELDGTLV